MTNITSHLTVAVRLHSVETTPRPRISWVQWSWDSSANTARNTSIYLVMSVHRQTKFGDWCGNECTRHPCVTAATWSKQRLIETWASIPQSVVDEAVDQWNTSMCMRKRKRQLFWTSVAGCFQSHPTTQRTLSDPVYTIQPVAKPV